MSQWYCRIEGKPTGPFSLEELGFLRDRGKISRSTEVQCGEDGPWSAAGSVESLFPTKTRVARDGHITAGIKEARQPQIAAGQTKTQQPVETVKPAAAAHQRPAPPPVPKLETQSDAGERLPRIAIGSSIIAGLLLLLCLIWLLLHLLTDDSRHVAIVPDGGGAVGQGSVNGAAALGSASSTAFGAASSSTDRAPEEAASGQASQRAQQAGQPAAGQDPQPSGDDSSEPTPERESIGDQPPDDPAPTALFQVTQFASEPEPAEASTEGDPTQPSEQTNPTEEAESGIDSPVKTIGGVKVKGKIALVCDVSGSMLSDFPILVRELREKFPSDTPLLLVNGCNFSPPNPGRQPPRKLAEMPGRASQVSGVNFDDDEHVYYANTTSDAIIFAVKELRRGTVMFNNDLQDGGSIRAIDAFEDLREEYPFVLSGRSLNRDAPKILHDFIEASGGEFKLDPIGRQPQPAMPWH